jgi:hypothetical protein
VVVVVLLLEGCDRLDIVRIIITDVGTDVVREGRERERDGWLHIKRSRHDDADKYIYQTDVNRLTPLALPIVVLHPLYNTSVGERDIKQPP